MNLLQTTCLGLGIILVFVGYKYYYDFIKDTEKDPYPWLIWSVLGLDVWVNTILSKESNLIEEIANSCFFFGPLSVAIVLFYNHGIKKPSKVDCILLALLGVFLTATIGLRLNPHILEGITDIEVGIIITSIAIILELCVITEILIEIYKNPIEEEQRAWGYWLVSCVLGLLAIYNPNITNGTLNVANASFSGTGVIYYLIVICSIILMYTGYHHVKNKLSVV